MSQDSSEKQGADGRLEQFERNRFFQGKLMTARDMKTEQDYHAQRLHVLNRFATGSGILHGAEVSSIEETDTELLVTIEPGVVIDQHGRPIVIENSTTKTVPLPSEDVIYLYIQFEKDELESVPVPEVRGAASEEYMSNRVVEGFELTYQESPPDSFDPVPTVDSSVDDETDTETFLHTLANRYHQQHRSEPEPAEDPAVYLGSFERTRDGSWITSAETARRSLVYDNEMLYSLLVSHITETDQPHVATVGLGDDLGMELSDLVEFAEEVERVRDHLDTLNRYVMRKTLKDEIRFFSTLADRFEGHNPEASRLAQNIVDQAKDAMAAHAFEDPETYRARVKEKLEIHLDLGEVLEDTATEESLERYVEAVDELQTALVEQEDIVKVAERQDQVCEAADSIEELYGVVKD